MKPKILITGMNTLQTRRDGYLRQELKVVPAHYSLIRVLESLGWDVEQRHVDLGEDLSHFDQVILYIHTPKAFCQRLYSGLYVAAVRPDAILSIDDWQFDRILRGITEFDESLDRDEIAFKNYLVSLYTGIEDADTIKSYKNTYKEGIANILSRKNRFLTAAFSNGNKKLFDSGWADDNFFTFNPNPWHLNRTPDNSFGTGSNSLEELFSGSIRLNNEKKEKKWAFASLMQDRTMKWLKSKTESCEWEIDYYGSRRGKFRSERKTEDQMCRTYEEHWGCLAPSYYHAGSGFWRPRALQLADAGSILAVDDAEGSIYSEAHVGVVPKDVEQMDISQLVDLAKRQREGIYDNHPLDKNITKEEIQKVLEAPIKI